ncbi:hypothetical protein CDV31_004887 [Fusarium ambrosium]|uniref:Uncharacterized protein n=1 Tax=Fusarium ambrosium TaxID=131363 RepID=A0A428UND0_9HYPO|nr:hypothetical protein CDV31_004887 [Fusarium ambrosium]
MHIPPSKFWKCYLDRSTLISGSRIPFSSFETEEARENTERVLEILQDNSRETSRNLALVLKAIERLATSTLEDEVVLKALDELLNNLVHKGVDTGDWEKQKALQTIHALVMMNTTAKAMARAVSLLGDQARLERAREFVKQATRD